MLMLRIPWVLCSKAFAFFFVLALSLIGQMATAMPVGLGENWRVEVQGRSLEVVNLKGSVGRWFPDVQGQNTYRYSKSFELATDSTVNEVHLMLPMNWSNLKVLVNDHIIADETKNGGALGRIFAERVIPIPPNVLKNKNNLVIEAHGHALRVGFRSAEVLLSDKKEDLSSAKLRNFIFNDSHILFIFLAIVIGFVSLWVAAFGEQSARTLRFLAWTTIGITPHHLLATDVYQFISHSEEYPFKFQMICQLLSWAAFLFIIAELGGRKLSIIDRIREVILGRSYLTPGIVACAFLLTLLPFSVFAIIAYPVFIVICVTCLVYTTFLEKSKHRNLMILGALLCTTTLISDLLFGDLYLLGHGTALFSLVCVTIVATTYRVTFLNAKLLTEIVKHSLPNSVHNRISTLVSGGETISTICDAVSGRDLLSIVLVDICDWGKMNDMESSGIPPGILKRSRAYAFSSFERTLEQHQFDLLKTAGDNMMFVGGLFDVAASKHVQLCDQTLRACKALLESIDDVNVQLRRQNLPSIRVKISVSMGDCEFGLEMYNKRLQFDVQGHPVNTAYRIESSVNDEFYIKFGRNVAVVSSHVILPCEDLYLRKRFSGRHSFLDKHGIEYDCFVGEQYESNLDIEDFTQALYGFYSHMKASPADDAHSRENAPGSDEISNAEGRYSPRRKLYLNDGFEVRAIHGEKVLPGRAIDLSERGMAVALDAGLCDGLVTGDVIDIAFDIEQQNLSVQAEIVYLSSEFRGSAQLRRVGLRFVPTLRNQSERKWRRFSVPNASAPRIVIQNPLDPKRVVVGNCLDVSSNGIAVQFSAGDLFLVRGMRKKIQFVVAGDPELELDAEVMYVQPFGDEQIRVGFQLVGNLSKFREVTGTFLVSAVRGDLTFSDIRDAGLSLVGTRRILDISYPSSDSEMDEIFSLRKMMLSDGDKDLAGDVSLTDKFDSFSRQLMCKVGDRVVAAVRVVFNDGNLEKMEHRSYGAEIPAELIESGFVEVSRLVVHPEFRGDEILWSMMTEIGRVALSSGCRFILQSCSAQLLPLYERFGFLKIGTFVSGNTTWNLCVLDVGAGVEGKNTTAMAWALVYSNLSETMQRRHSLKLGFVGRARTALLETARPTVLARYTKLRGSVRRRKNPTA